MVVNDECVYPEEIHAFLPKLQRSDYFLYPGVHQLASLELEEPGYCSRVTDFVVGCREHGHIKFLGETDVRWLDIDSIVFFRHREVVVYDEEETKPPVGSGLNKPAEVTFYNIQCKNNMGFSKDSQMFVERLKRKADEQGASFVSYDATKQEWKLSVQHFSRFALDDSDEDEPLQDDYRAVSSMEDDIMLQDMGPIDTVKSPEIPVWQHDRSDVGSEDIEVEGSPMQDIHYTAPQSALSHSLPQHLKLDPLKMQQMKMLFFPSGEETESATFPDRIPFQSAQKAAPQIITQVIPRQDSPGWKKKHLSPAEESPRAVTFSKHIMKVSPQTSWRRLSNHSPSPLGRHINPEMEEEVSPVKHSRMLLSLESKNEHSALKRSTAGFKNEISPSSCMFGRSDNIVDAALFLGCSFRVGWGPHGFLAHSGNPVGLQGYTVSSVITIEQVAFDNCVRDDEGKVREDFVEMQFVSPLKLHMSISKSIDGMNEKLSKIKFRYVQCDRRVLSSICNKYEDILVKHYAAEGASDSQRLILRHQVMVWNLLNVLFSEKVSVKEQVDDIENEDDVFTPSQYVDPDTAGLIRRAEFSSWLQDSVRHIIDADLADVDANEQLKELFALLTGRQLDEAVQLAVTRGDIRLACLLSQAGGSMITRRDIASQLNIWEEEGFDFNLIERDMVLLYKLLSGDIQGALEGRVIDWKRYLGLLMWYNLAPDTQLPEIIKSYSFLVEDNDSAPLPIPMYIEEGTLVGISNVQKELYDTAYYLMLLYANQGKNLDVSKMFSSSSSTYDPLDHKMAWFQHALLEAIGALTPIQLHVLDMNFVSQLLAIGKCHWALYVVLHMPLNSDYPDLHEKVIKEILHQYCEVWSTNELQQTFIERELGIPPEWLHEALGTYWQYKNDSHKAIKHLLKSKKWHEAHTLLMTSVAASLYILGQYDELLEIVNALEGNKMELDEWAISGGIFADFFMLKNSFQRDDLPDEIGSGNKIAACRSFFQRLKESQAIWESNSSTKNRVAYSRMAHELASLLLSEKKPKMWDDETAELKLYYSVMDAPVPEDSQFYNLQGAASSFTSWLVQTVPH